jgi:hypothetical protein
LFVTLADNRIEIGNSESEGLVVGGPRVSDLVLPMIVVFDLEDASRLVTCVLRCPLKHRRLERIEGGSGKDITAISHARNQLIPVS